MPDRDGLGSILDWRPVLPIDALSPPYATARVRPLHWPYTHGIHPTDKLLQAGLDKLVIEQQRHLD
jgi:hypothetical protein